jgi:hypothetical protein
MSRIGVFGLRALCVLAVILSLASACRSADAADVVRIEEGWVLVLGEPYPDLDAPQVSCGMSPLADFNSAYVVFNVNHRNQPSYVPVDCSCRCGTTAFPC